MHKISNSSRDLIKIMQVNTLRGIAGRSQGYDDEDHLLSTGTAACGYDLDGFLTAKTEGSDITAYDYSLRGELLRVDLPGGRTISYVYDPLRRRIAKKINGTIVEKYLWQDLTKLIDVYDASDNLVMRFEYADGRMPVSMTKAGTVYYLSYDPVGSLRLVADASGSVVKKIEYDSFGNILSDTAPSFGVPFGFAGGLYDSDTGLVRFGYRDYDPDVRRWTAKDPILFGGGDSDLYGYCLNDPVNFVDKRGLFLSNGSQAYIDGAWVEGDDRGDGTYSFHDNDGTMCVWNDRGRDNSSSGFQGEEHMKDISDSDSTDVTDLPLEKLMQIPISSDT